MEWLWWVAAALVLGVMELVSLTLVLLMFAGGALAAAIVTALGGALGWQIAAFAIVSVVLLLAMRPWLLRHWRRRIPLVETNVSAHVGRIATTLDRVTQDGGRVKLQGEVWTARTEQGVPDLPAGAQVRVVRIDGATAVVAPSEQQIR